MRLLTNQELTDSDINDCRPTLKLFELETNAGSKAVQFGLIHGELLGTAFVSRRRPGDVRLDTLRLGSCMHSSSTRKRPATPMAVQILLYHPPHPMTGSTPRRLIVMAQWNRLERDESWM